VDVYIFLSIAWVIISRIINLLYPVNPFYQILMAGLLGFCVFLTVVDLDSDCWGMLTYHLF